MRFESWWVWMSMAAVMLAIEVVRIRSFFLWLSIGAASSGILALLGISIPGQVVVFINISGILILLERRFSERFVFKQPEHNQSVTIADPNPNVFRRSGDFWEIKFAGVSHTAKNSIGLVHVRNLLLHAGEWVPCSELKRISSKNWGDSESISCGRMNDNQLEIENLRLTTDLSPEKLVDRLSLDKIRKLRDILLEQKETDDFESPEDRIDKLKTLDFVEKYLKSVTDKKGRSRKVFDQEDMDRKAVSIAINRSRNNLRKHPELFIHLKSFIQAEGNSFRYLPDRPIYWKTD